MKNLAHIITSISPDFTFHQSQLGFKIYIMTKPLSELDFLPETVKRNVLSCLEGKYDEGYKRKVLHLLHANPKALADAFSKTVSFGTGGIRELMGVGTNRLNEYTIESATQGLANYIVKQPKKRPHHRVFISYDSRKHSFFFAKTAARVLAGNGIEAYIVKNLRPTPLCSFGCIYYHCTAAIMITASHNPPEYNGYKVYWNDGAQVLPPHDKGIIAEVQKVKDLSAIRIAKEKDPLIHWVDESLDKIYLKTVHILQNYPKENKKNGGTIHIVYSNLHGTGITIVPQLLRNWGFTKIDFVKEQLACDPKFPGALKPNPEEKEALEPGVRLLLEKKADLLLVTDPDSDRVGVVIPHKEGAISFTGNQIACICLYHLLETKRMPQNAAFVKTIVTTELFREICDAYKKPCFDVLTGFKYIAQKIREWEEKREYRFIFGGEESLGYLLGTFVRDKDAATASGLIAECVLSAKNGKKSLYDLLREIYQKFGVFREKLTSISFASGDESMQKMKKMMDTLRKNPPEMIGKKRVTILEDYEARVSTELGSKKEIPLSLPKSNVLRFWLDDHSKVVIRPSGTEPKIKIYAGVVRKEFSNLDETIQKCDEELLELIHSLESHFGKKEA